MSNYHFERWLYKTIVGFMLVAGGVFFMYYAVTHFYSHNWVWYASTCSAAAGVGTYLLSSGAVNKIKSDLIKKQKLKQQSA